MSAFPDYDRHDAVGLAKLVQTGQVTASELLAEAMARCDAVNPTLNAVIHRLDEEARQTASRIDRTLPFAGVPFLAKDLGPALANAPLTFGSRLFKNFLPKQDGKIIARFKASGLVPFGKTNIPEFGLLPVTEPELFGPCRNPWDTGRTPGGSSGGAAAAVASGIVPMAHASDGGGSIRIPASCCGLFGLKPTRGLNPRDFERSTVTDDFTVDHVVSRSVRDTAAALDAVCEQPGFGFLSQLEVAPDSLRVGVVRSAMLGQSVAPEVKAGLDGAAKLLENLGHRVEDAEPAVDYAELGMAFLTFWSVGNRQILDAAEALTGRKTAKADVELATWTLSVVGGVMTESDLALARTAIWKATKAYTDFLNRYDVLVSPVLAAPPLRIGQNAVTATEKVAMNLLSGLKSAWLLKTLLRQVAAKSFAFAAFTAPFNMTGQPAISVPLHWTSDGLPVGIQIGAKLGADALLLRLARQLEEAQPWREHRPRIWAGDERLKAAA